MNIEYFEHRPQHFAAVRLDFLNLDTDVVAAHLRSLPGVSHVCVSYDPRGERQFAIYSQHGPAADEFLLSEQDDIGRYLVHCPPDVGSGQWQCLDAAKFRVLFQRARSRDQS